MRLEQQLRQLGMYLQDIGSSSIYTATAMKLAGDALYDGDQKVGFVTCGMVSRLSGRSMAIARMDTAYALPGRPLALRGAVTTPTKLDRLDSSCAALAITFCGWSGVSAGVSRPSRCTVSMVSTNRR